MAGARSTIAIVIFVAFLVSFGTYQLVLGQLAKTAHDITQLQKELATLNQEMRSLRASVSDLGSRPAAQSPLPALPNPVPNQDLDLIPHDNSPLVPNKPAVPAATRASEDGLTLWIVPHSHTDPGWHKSFEGYYTEQVVNILTSAMNALKDHPHRKFSWVEVCFFERWWRDQTEEMRELVRRLYKDGQLEFVMGGWVSNDEATVTYIQSVQQMTEGHRWLQENVAPDIVPKVAWQIDPFGLSAGMAYIFGEMGLDAEVSWRITEDELASYLNNKESEFVWEGHRDVGEASRVLLHLLPHREYGYGVPLEFFFDNNGRLPTNEQRVADLAHDLVRLLAKTAESYPHRQVLWLWGFDFAFTNAAMQFGAMDSVVDYINAHPTAFNVPGGVKARYATPSNYFDALRQVAPPFALRQDKDYFPYQAGPVNFWTGYFTSRPHFKRTCRHLDAVLRLADTTLALGQVTGPSGDNKQFGALFEEVEKARWNNGILQHHDAITGTMWQTVLDDYYRLYKLAFDAAARVAGASVSAMIGVAEPCTFLTPVAPAPKFDTPTPALVAGSQLAVTNTLAWEVTEWTCVSTPAEAGLLDVLDDKGAAVPTQPLPQRQVDWSRLAFVQDAYRLCFLATVPPMGVRVYHLAKAADPQTVTIMTASAVEAPFAWTRVIGVPDEAVKVKNELVEVTLERGSSLAVQSLKDLGTGKEWLLKHELWAYRSDVAWDNSYTFKASGEAFRPTERTYAAMLLQGKHVTELVQCTTAEAVGPMRYETRLWEGYRHLDLTHHISPPNGGSSLNVVSRWRSSLVSDLYFYTDDQGLLPFRRRYNPGVMVSGNYFPSVYSVTIRDEKNFEQGIDGELLLALDTSLGVTSPEGGTVEVMVHRRSLQPGEAALNDEVPLVYRSSLLLGSISAAVATRRQQTIYQLNYPLSVLLLPSTLDPLITTYSPLLAPVPPPLFVATLRPFNSTRGLLALQVAHVEPALGSHPQSFDPELLLDTQKYPLKSVAARSLSFNQPADASRRRWPTKADSAEAAGQLDIKPHADDVRNEVPPMHLRSWLLTLETH